MWYQEKSALGLIHGRGWEAALEPREVQLSCLEEGGSLLCPCTSYSSALGCS